MEDLLTRTGQARLGKGAMSRPCKLPQSTEPGWRAPPERHLSGAEAEDELLHGAQTFQGQLQADVEEQEHDTQLRQVAHTFHVPHNACTIDGVQLLGVRLPLSVSEAAICHMAHPDSARWKGWELVIIKWCGLPSTCAYSISRRL